MDLQNSTEKVVEKLINIYGSCLDREIIRSVAYNCKFQLAQSAAILDDISANVDLSQASKRSPEKTRLPCNNLNGEIASPCYRSAYCTPSGPADSQIAFITDQIKKGYKVLVILRGLPGSGKSYLARRLVENTVSSQEYHRFIFSADDYFMRRGVYQYDVSKISDAHTFNQQRAFEAMRRGVSPVIIDNTNTQIWEMRSYGMVGAQFSYIIEVLEPDTPWAFNWRELDRRNTHRVPQEKLREMLSRYERNITADKLIRTFKINYKNLLPPQFRTYPPLHTSQTMRGRNHTSKGVEKTKRQKECIKNTDLSCAQATPQEQNVMLTVDDLLSYSDEDKNVLEPSIVSWGCEQNIKKDAAVSSDNNLEVSDAVEQKAKDVIVPDLSTWGISESALYSWDICTPISDAKDSSQNISNETGSVQPLETLDASTNTSVIDFSFAADPINKACTEGRVVATQNRDINDQCSFPTLPPRKKIMIDCSSMVGEDLLSEEQIDKKEALQKLSSVFPSVPHIYLGEMYEKCRGDINWAIDLLCDDNIQNLVSPQEMEESPEEIVEETAQSNNEGTDSVDESETSTVSSLSNNDADAGNRENLKKLLEEKVVIRDDFYSEHTLKLKSLRSPVNIPSTEEPVYPSTSKVETISTAAGDVIAVNSDTEMDDFDFEATSHSPTASDESEMIELNLGEGFVTELENKLKESTLKYPKGFLPVVQVPIGLARQLYALYIESVYQQMDAQKEVLDMLIKEDEEFAKKLQAEEQQQHYKTETKEPTTLPEIMQEQHTLRLCQRETEDWKNLTPDDLAAKLTKQKLFEAFPRIEKDVLTEIWQAHGNNYKDTVESILASDPAQAATSVVAVSNPPLSQEVLQEMKEAHDQQNCLSTSEEKSATSYRQDAAVHLKNRKILYQKAMQAYQQGMSEVAIFYSDLARKQTELYERANSLAASTFLQEHSNRLQNYDTLDLHFLYVDEALSALDIFLDNNIHLLQGTGKTQHLFVITGRGKRSVNGIPKIKPSVKARLKKRQVNYVEVNPGLLKVKISEHSVVTTDLA